MSHLFTEFHWFFKNFLKGLLGALPGCCPAFLQILLQSTEKEAESSPVWRRQKSLESGLLDSWQRSFRRFQLREGASPSSSAWKSREEKGWLST